jgi:hypothetical protein
MFSSQVNYQTTDPTHTLEVKKFSCQSRKSSKYYFCKEACRWFAVVTNPKDLSLMFYPAI